VLAGQCDTHAARLQPFADRYREDAPDEPDRLYSELFKGPREGGLGLLRDLHDLQAAQGLRDEDLFAVVEGCEGETAAQLQWLKSRMKQAAPQVLVVVR
jgi:hypothetical protein